MKKCFNQQIFKRMMMGIIAAALFVIWAMDFVNAGTFKPEELEIVWTDFELYNDFKEGLTPTKDKKYLINKKGEIVFRPNEQFDSFEGFSDGLAAFSKDYKKGYINLQGKIVIPAQFDYAEEFWDGLARVVNDSKSGFINKQGKLVIPMKYDLATPFIEGFSWVTRNNKIFYVDKKGVERSIDHYENMAYVYSDGLSWMKENGKYGYIDKQGNVAIPFVYNSADYFSEGLGLVRQGKKKMFIDTKGNVVINLKNYDSVGSFSEGMAWFKKDGKYGYIDRTGKEVIPAKWQGRVFPFVQGLAKVQVEEGVGYIDRQGNFVIPPIFELIVIGETDYGDFSEGVAIVKKDGKYGILKHPMPNYAEISKEIKQDTITATYSKLPITLNGKAVEDLEAYSINGNTYFKLRDIAMLAQATTKKFSVEWNGEKKMISLQIGKDYVANGSELKAGNQQNKKAVKSTAKIEVNGKEITPTAYTINGNNYFKLRELGDVLDFEVEWNDDSKRIEVEMK